MRLRADIITRSVLTYNSNSRTEREGLVKSEEGEEEEQLNGVMERLSGAILSSHWSPRPPSEPRMTFTTHSRVCPALASASDPSQPFSARHPGSELSLTSYRWPPSACQFHSACCMLRLVGTTSAVTTAVATYEEAV